VVKTLVEAIILVFLVMYLFLQNFRATLIPTIAVPVVLLGTFAILAAFGFSINTLTMFGMVLAIGLLVDDAIVVVENVERVMAEEGLPPKEAPVNQWARSRARWSVSRWCCLRYLSRWPSSAALPVRFTVSSPSPSFPRWRCRYWWR
jgi:multidrug efflux pump